MSPLLVPSARGAIPAGARQLFSRRARFRRRPRKFDEIAAISSANVWSRTRSRQFHRRVAPSCPRSRVLRREKVPPLLRRVAQPAPPVGRRWRRSRRQQPSDCAHGARRGGHEWGRKRVDFGELSRAVERGSPRERGGEKKLGAMVCLAASLPRMSGSPDDTKQ
jgi:hypothetical protein